MIHLKKSTPTWFMHRRYLRWRYVRAQRSTCLQNVSAGSLQSVHISLNRFWFGCIWDTDASRVKSLTVQNGCLEDLSFVSVSRDDNWALMNKDRANCKYCVRLLVIKSASSPLKWATTASVSVADLLIHPAIVVLHRSTETLWKTIVSQHIVLLL